MFLEKLQNKIIFVLGILLIPIFSFATTTSFTENFDEYGPDTSLINSLKWKRLDSGSLSVFSLATNFYLSSPKSMKSTLTSALCSVSSSFGNNFTANYNVLKSNTGLNQIFLYATALDTCSTSYIGGSSYHHISAEFDLASGTSCALTIRQLGYSDYKQLTGITCPAQNQWSSIISLEKLNDNARLCYSSSCTDWLTLGDPNVSFSSLYMQTESWRYYDNINVISNNEVNTTCGSDDGQILSSDPINFCGLGTLITPTFIQTSEGWTWTCGGENGGSNAYCSAEYGITPSGGTCGADNGQILTTDPTNFCGFGNLVTPTYIKTSTGWSWDCAGYNGGSISHCYAEKDDILINYPEAPAEEDCSSYSVPDSWFCEIGSSLRSIFFPSKAKTQELNNKYNEIGNKAPFNYIFAVSSQLSNLNIQDGNISFSLLGNSGTINLDAWGDVLILIKRISSLLLVFGFLFWALGYIKHFFK